MSPYGIQVLVVVSSLVITLAYGDGIDKRKTIVEGDSTGLSRAKRYAGGRVPLNYMNIALGHSQRNVPQSHFRNMKRFRGETNSNMDAMPSAPSYRSFQIRPTKETFDAYDESDMVPLSTQPLYASGSDYYNFKHGGGKPLLSAHVDPDALDNEEMEELALLLRNSDYPLMSSPYLAENELPYNNYPLTSEDLRRVSRMYNVGKREQEEGNNHHNSYQQSATEFLPLARNKRIGARNFMTKTSTNKGKRDANVPSEKSSIDWSQYFGVDKKNDKTLEGEKDTAVAVPTTVTPKPASIKIEDKENKGKEQTKQDKAARLRQENETTNKDDKVDRDWILHEFYKNLAMSSSSMKRKRDSSSGLDVKDEEIKKLEDQMAAAGDDIIWKTLKFTGAHKDEVMTPEQLSQVKAYIIKKLTAAYSLEKLRESLEDFRLQLNKKLETQTK